jgi:hypothetical protein
MQHHPAYARGVTIAPPYVLFLQGLNMFKEEALNKMTSFNGQLNALQAPPGWHDVHTTSLID